VEEQGLAKPGKLLPSAKRAEDDIELSFSEEDEGHSKQVLTLSLLAMEELGAKGKTFIVSGGL